MIKQFTKFCKSPIAVYMQPIYLQIGCIFFIEKMGQKFRVSPIQGYKHFDTSYICRIAQSFTLQIVVFVWQRDNLCFYSFLL